MLVKDILCIDPTQMKSGENRLLKNVKKMISVLHKDRQVFLFGVIIFQNILKRDLILSFHYGLIKNMNTNPRQYLTADPFGRENTNG